MARLMSLKNSDQEAVEVDVVVVVEEAMATLTMMIQMKAAMAIQEGLHEALGEASPAEAVEAVEGAAMVTVRELLQSR